MSRFIYCFAECHYAERRYAERRGADPAGPHLQHSRQVLDDEDDSKADDAVGDSEALSHPLADGYKTYLLVIDLPG